ncbi:hypothetical protein J5X92_13200 [Alteromonas sp. K632G]|uniref:hypothetical protein n=1 Tax=Alteromonas sp. K632G TaxID=2820757 RepID=UPI001AD7D20E|nr:hypothetical protein [Alteromonas sp. K632G]MBO7923178.1 hypothetical protein [Alteromonas sp. K632G]
MKQDERIERYVLGRMTPSEEAEFEAYFLSNQACLDQLELTERLYKGMQANSVDKVTPIQSKPRVWKQPIPLWAAAAALILVLLMPTPFNTSQRLAPNSDLNVYRLEMANVRASEFDAVKVTQSDSQLVFAIYVDTEIPEFDYPKYGFTLTNQKGEQVFTTSALHLTSTSEIFINMGLQHFESGVYDFEVSGYNNTTKTPLHSGLIQFN